MINWIIENFKNKLDSIGNDKIKKKFKISKIIKNKLFDQNIVY